jgi:hypothetical protein
VPLGPEARYEQTEAMSLAFMTALQVLPARQRAVLIMRAMLSGSIVYPVTRSRCCPRCVAAA